MEQGLSDRKPTPRKFWNKIPEDIKEHIVEVALEYPEKSPRQLAWKLCSTMSATDVKETLDKAVEVTGVDHVKVRHKPRLLSDNGPCYLSSELKEYLDRRDIRHIRGAPFHPQTQGKIERYHRSIKNVINLENYYFPWGLENAITEFVDYYNNHRYHESLENLKPVDVFFGRDKEILSERQIIKERTMKQRKRQNRKMFITKKVFEFEECVP